MYILVISVMQHSQDISYLTFWIRSLEEVLREVLWDDRMAGLQHFIFEMIVNEESGEREFGPSNSAASFQLASVRADSLCPCVTCGLHRR